MLRTRIITAVVLALIFLTALFFLPEALWRVFSFIIAMVALWEWARIAQLKGKAAQFFLGLSLVLGLLLLYSFNQSLQHPIGKLTPQIISLGLAAACLFWILAVPLWLKFAWRPQRPCLLGMTGWLIVFPTWFALIAHRNNSPWVLLGLMALVWVADIAAYFTGRAFGKHPLAPNVSPGKTWEGVLGAMLGVLLYAALCVWLAERFGSGEVRAWLSNGLIVVIAFPLLVALSVLGDLFESWMKRGAGLKDSSNLLPGHGGVLDRVDALTSTLPLAPFVFLIAGKIVSP